MTNTLLALAITLTFPNPESGPALTASKYADTIMTVSTQEQVDPLLVVAIITRESRWRAHAVGRAKELGLMQLKRDGHCLTTHAVTPHVTHRQLLDPDINILIGVQCLAQTIKRCDNNIDKALGRYNGGGCRVTQYSKKINTLYQKLKRQTTTDVTLTSKAIWVLND